MLGENNILLISLHNFGFKGQTSLEFLILRVTWLVRDPVGSDPVERAKKTCTSFLPAISLIVSTLSLKQLCGLNFPVWPHGALASFILGRCKRWGCFQLKPSPFSAHFAGAVLLVMWHDINNNEVSRCLHSLFMERSFRKHIMENNGWAVGRQGNNCIEGAWKHHKAKNGVWLDSHVTRSQGLN